ncbi:hypothetical protein ACJX0J_036851, partial [Zea mays]
MNIYNVWDLCGLSPSMTRIFFAYGPSIGASGSFITIWKGAHFDAEGQAFTWLLDSNVVQYAWIASMAPMHKGNSIPLSKAWTLSHMINLLRAPKLPSDAFHVPIVKLQLQVFYNYQAWTDRIYILFEFLLARDNMVTAGDVGKIKKKIKINK